jgi:hypothetical protein
VFGVTSLVELTYLLHRDISGDVRDPIGNYWSIAHIHEFYQRTNLSVILMLSSKLPYVGLGAFNYDRWPSVKE